MFSLIKDEDKDDIEDKEVAPSPGMQAVNTFPSLFPPKVGSKEKEHLCD
jgi:hypothetical protein